MYKYVYVFDTITNDRSDQKQVPRPSENLLIEKVSSTEDTGKVWYN